MANSRFLNILPYLLLLLGILFYLSPLLPLSLAKTEDFLVLTAPHYIVASVLMFLAARGRGERSLHMIAAPAASLVASAGMLLPGILFLSKPPTSPYSPAFLEILAYSNVSVLFSLGISIRTRKVRYVAVLMLMYVAVVVTVAVSVLDENEVVSLGEVAVLFVATAGPLLVGVPLAVVAYLQYGKYERATISNSET